MKIDKTFAIKPQVRDSELDAKIRDAAKMYEGQFLNEMVKAMRTTTGREDGVIKQNFAEKIFTEQLDNQYVDGWTNKGGIGLADMIYEQISQKIKPQGGGLPRNRVLPLSPKPEMHGIPNTDSIQMKAIPKEAGLEYRLSVPHPSGAAFEAQAPLEGRVVESKSIEDGWQSVKLDHGRGLTSELTFPGASAQISAGTEVQAGQRLGLLDSSRPVLAWKLDWT